MSSSFSVADDAAINALAQTIAGICNERRATLVTAESCTGGWVGQEITAIASSSDYYDRGFITYSNAAKQAMLREFQRYRSGHNVW